MITCIIILTVVSLLGLKHSYRFIKYGMDCYIDREIETDKNMFPYIVWGILSIVYVFIAASILIINYLP